MVLWSSDDSQTIQNTGFWTNEKQSLLISNYWRVWPLLVKLWRRSRSQDGQPNKSIFCLLSVHPCLLHHLVLSDALCPRNTFQLRKANPHFVLENSAKYHFIILGNALNPFQGLFNKAKWIKKSQRWSLEIKIYPHNINYLSYNIFCFDALAVLYSTKFDQVSNCQTVCDCWTSSHLYYCSASLEYFGPSLYAVEKS